MKFNHFGLAVFNFEPAVSFFRKLGYEVSPPVSDLEQNVELVMCTAQAQPAVELIKALNEKSPVWPFLKKNNEMVYHTCYTVNNIEQAINKNLKGFRVIKLSEPKPAILFQNALVGFYYVKGIGLIELLEKNQDND